LCILENDTQDRHTDIPAGNKLKDARSGAVSSLVLMLLVLLVLLLLLLLLLMLPLMAVVESMMRRV
jgi:hypothetical protein